MKPTEMTMTTTEKKTYTLAHGLSCISGGSRSCSQWGTHFIGSLWDALHDPHAFDKHAGEFQPGDRVFLCSYRDDVAFRLNERAEVGSVIVLRVRKPLMATDGTKVAGSVWFNRLDYFSLAPADIRGYELPQPEEVAA